MLKEKKLLRSEFIKVTEEGEFECGEKNVVGFYTFDSIVGDVCATIKDDPTKFNLSENDYYFTEFETERSVSDYHSCYETYKFKGVYLTFNLNLPDTRKYFGKYFIEGMLDEEGFLDEIKDILNKHNLNKEYDECEISLSERGYLQVVLINEKLDDKVLKCANDILNHIRKYFDENAMHVTRMFGSYILLKKVNGQLQAVHATPIPIKYCPLMIKLLNEVGGEVANKLISSLKIKNEEEQTKMLCELINETVIKSGYFDTNRPLNSCEANVLFGASETMSSAFKTNMIDAAVIVSNNLGTIITTNEFNTQGAVKRMTGLFHTSPNEHIVQTAIKEGIIPVYPYTATIDQLEGVKKAISLGYKRIAVSIAAYDNYLHKELSKLEKEHNITIYKFGLCSTGIDEETAKIMQENADVVWSCASKYVKELVEPNAIAQVGIKIPVHIMTKQGWEIVKNHLLLMNTFEEIELKKGEEKPILLNNNGFIKTLKKNQLHNCSDCPNPCV